MPLSPEDVRQAKLANVMQAVDEACVRIDATLIAYEDRYPIRISGSLIENLKPVVIQEVLKRYRRVGWTASTVRRTGYYGDDLPEVEIELTPAPTKKQRAPVKIAAPEFPASRALTLKNL